MAERRLWYYESTDRNTIPEGVTGPHAVPRSIRENLDRDRKRETRLRRTAWGL